MSSSLKLRNILAVPILYRAFTKAIGGNAHSTIIRDYVQPRDAERVLDIGCGPGDILTFMPAVDYVGFDMDEDYIKAAQERYGDRGTFFCKRVSNSISNELPPFDIVISYGVLHHLDDEEAIELFRLAKGALKDGGRLITVDGCFVDKQSSIARFVLSRDRGRYVRDRNAYLKLATKVFDVVNTHVRHDLLNIPYTHIVLECKKVLVPAQAAVSIPQADPNQRVPEADFALLEKTE